MSGDLEKLNVEETEGSRKITLRQTTGKDILIGILVSGILWFYVIILWKYSTFSFGLGITALSMLFQVYLLLFTVFGTNTIEINGDDVTIKRIEAKWFPRWRTLHVSLSEIEKVFYVFHKSHLGRRLYDVNIQLKSGKVVNLAWKVGMKNDSEAEAIVKRLKESLDRLLLPPER